MDLCFASPGLLLWNRFYDIVFLQTRIPGILLNCPWTYYAQAQEKFRPQDFLFQCNSSVEYTVHSHVDKFINNYCSNIIIGLYHCCCNDYHWKFKWRILMNPMRILLSLLLLLNSPWKKLSAIYMNHNTSLLHCTTNRIYNKILDRDWFSARLFVT